MARDHFAPHRSPQFEGYYTRVQLEDGGTLALIFCWTRRAETRKNLVHVSYVPAPSASRTASCASSSSMTAESQGPQPSQGAEGKRTATASVVESPAPSAGSSASASTSAIPPPGFQYEFFPPTMSVSRPRACRPDTDTNADQDGEPFIVSAPGLGHMSVSRSTIEYALAVPALRLRLHLVLDAHTPWSTGSGSGLGSGPMGKGLLRLEAALPLCWHVRSVRSRARYVLAHAGLGADADAVEGTGVAHVEKNWGGAFPKGWLWAQAFQAADDEGEADAGAKAEHDGKRVGRDTEKEGEEGKAGRTTTFCMAGGAAFPGVRAYLVGYRSRTCQWDFRPPFAVAVASCSPFLRVEHDSRQGRVVLRVSSWTRRLDVRIDAPPDSFVGMAAPLRDGHRPGFAHESFQARVCVTASRRRRPWAKWEVVEESVLGLTAGGVRCGALEFGGCYYHEADQ